MANTLTSEQEIALAKVIEDSTRAMRREILCIPLAARLLLTRWSELRSANRVAATLGGIPPDGRRADASARMDDSLRRVAILLDRRDRLRGNRGGLPSGATLAQIDQEVQRGGRSVVAFAVWNGARNEAGSRKMRSAWIPLAVE